MKLSDNFYHHLSIGFPSLIVKIIRPGYYQLDSCPVGPYR